MTSQPNFVYVAPLRNHPHEYKFTEYEPIKTSFQELERRQHKAVRTRSDYKPFMDKLSEQVLRRDDLVTLAHRWLEFVAQIRCPSAESKTVVDVFLARLWAEWPDAERPEESTQALRDENAVVLRKLQKTFAKAAEAVEVVKDSLIVDQLDDTCYRRDEECTARHSFLPPLDSFEDDDSVDKSWIGEPVVIQFDVGLPKEHMILTARNQTAWRLFFENEQEYYMTRWTDALRSYFQPSNGKPYDNVSALVDVVDSIREMRAVPKRVYKDTSWLVLVEKTGLFDLIIFICDPANLPCPSEPHVQRAYAMYSFKSTFGAIMKDWMPEGVSLEVKESVTGSIKKDLKEFFDILDTNPAFVPQPWNPSAIFFLTCLDAFKSAWTEWLCPAILSTGKHPDAKSWNIDALYSSFCSKSRADRPKFIKSFQYDRLATIIDSTYNFFKIRKEAHKQAFRPCRPQTKCGKAFQQPHTKTASKDKTNKSVKKGECQNCKDKPTEEKCVRSLEGKMIENVAQYHGFGITSAECHDVLHAKNLETGSEDRILHTSKLDWIHVQARPEVYACCGRDVTLIHAPVGHEEKTDEEWLEDLGVNVCAPLTAVKGQEKRVTVGAVRFEAFSEAHVEDMIEHASHLKGYKGVKRGQSFESYAFGGIMIPVGSRAAMGGRPADTYTTYAYMPTGQNLEDISILFEHAKDAEILKESLRPFIPDKIRAMDDLTRQGGLNRLGSTGMNLYYCTNYMSPVHADRDALRHSLCCQLQKKNCLPDEFNFCYTRWGVLLHTQQNTVWMFRSEDEHCTELPRRSSWERRRPQDSAPARPATTRSRRPSSSIPSGSAQTAHAPQPGQIVSTGAHETITWPDFTRAQRMYQVRNEHEARAEWWNEYSRRMRGS